MDDVARARAREHALEEDREVGVLGLEADEQEAARAIQLVCDGAIDAVGERAVHVLGGEYERARLLRVAEHLPHVAELAVLLQLGDVRRRVHAWLDTVLRKGALERGAVARGHDGAEGQLTERGHDRRRIVLADDLVERAREAIAELATNPAGRGERARVEHRQRVAGLRVGHAVDELLDDTAIRIVAAEARTGAEHAATFLKLLDETSEFVRHRRRLLQ